MQTILCVVLAVLSLSSSAQDLSAEVNAKIANTPPAYPGRTGTTAGAGTDSDAPVDHGIWPIKPSAVQPRPVQK